MRHFPILIAALISTAIQAAPPPPPPEYVWNASKILTAPSKENETAILALFAEDVVAFQNGATVAKGKSEWLKWRRDNLPPNGGQVVAYSEGWMDGGSLMIIETFDTVDRVTLPKHFIADPRIATRTTLYQFDKDRLIHTVRVLRIDSWLRRLGGQVATNPENPRR